MYCMDWYTLVITIVATIITIIIGFLITKHYYIQASKQLIDAANKLIKLSNLITRALEDAGIAEFGRDAKGCPRGLILKKGTLTLDTKTDTKGSISIINEEKK